MVTQINSSTLYDTDFNLWIEATVKQLKSGDFNEIDLDNLIEEIEAMGRSEKRELKSRLAILIMHLLKWKYQGIKRSNSWLNTIREQRLQLSLLLQDSPSLKPLLEQEFEQWYNYAKKEAAKETKLSLNTFPESCPFTIEMVLDSDFLPE
ncbi:DUF29 domain-containing protein [Cyanothece sp. BG0011]|uniref:DUF29 domain-containing protein n=1 Tax=Cyanothece sp. BG0011 TaxID=2082950 RepID=UPI000D1DA171|nr:DUF29 domain-containing protein [Cyanothece sp. BG0011]